MSSDSTCPDTYPQIQSPHQYHHTSQTLHATNISIDTRQSVRATSHPFASLRNPQFTHRRHINDAVSRSTTSILALNNDTRLGVCVYAFPCSCPCFGCCVACMVRYVGVDTYVCVPGAVKVRVGVCCDGCTVSAWARSRGVVCVTSDTYPVG